MTAAEILARRAARIAFGLVLGVGIFPIAIASSTAHGDVLARQFGVMWVLAVGASTVVRLLVRRFARPSEPDVLLRESLVVPAVGLALALPLSLHVAFMVSVGAEWVGLAEWVSMSIRAVGLAHLVFAALFATRAWGLATTAKPAVSIAAIFCWTLVASAIPLGMLVMPVIVTGVTGICILPVLVRFDRIAAAERASRAPVPRAIVMACHAPR